MTAYFRSSKQVRGPSSFILENEAVIDLRVEVRVLPSFILEKEAILGLRVEVLCGVSGLERRRW